MIPISVKSPTLSFLSFHPHNSVSYYKASSMTNLTIPNILQKIRSLCKECNFDAIPDKVSTLDNSENLQAYFKALESIRLELVRFHRMEEEYSKLEKLLQREETELRRRIGIENQMKLYIEALKQQVEEVEREKTEFRENTKVYIKDLKKVNQQLFMQLSAEVNKNRNITAETHADNSQKKAVKEKLSEYNSKSFTKNKTKRERSIKEIIKTECIQREKFKTDIKKPRKIHHYKLQSSIISDCEGDNHILQENLKTYQEYNADTGRRTKNIQPQNNKGNGHQTLTTFFDQSKISTRKNQKHRSFKSPLRERQEAFLKKGETISRNVSRERRHNRSVYSVLSAQQSQVKKELP